MLVSVYCWDGRNCRRSDTTNQSSTNRSNTGSNTSKRCPMKCANRISENNFFDILDKLSKKSGTHLRIHLCRFCLVQLHNLLPQSCQCCSFLIWHNLFCNRNIVFITA